MTRLTKSNLPKNYKEAGRKNEGDNMYRVGWAEQRRHLKTPADHRNVWTLRLRECSRKTVRAILTRPKAKGKDDIKCTPLAHHRNVITLRLRERSRKTVRAVLTCPKAKGKDDIKCTLLADHRNGRMECSTCMPPRHPTSWPQKWVNVKVGPRRLLNWFIAPGGLFSHTNCRTHYLKTQWHLMFLGY